jgi:hypothetical protein
MGRRGEREREREIERETLRNTLTILFLLLCLPQEVDLTYSSNEIERKTRNV